MPHCALSTWTWTCIIAFAADPVETRDATMACPDRLHFRRGAHLLAFYRVAHNTRPCLGLPPPHGTHCSLCCCSLCCVRPGASQLVSCAPLSDHSPHAVARAMCHSPHGPAHAHSCLRWPSLYWCWLACALLPFGPCELADGSLRFLADDEAPKLQSTLIPRNSRSSRALRSLPYATCPPMFLRCSSIFSCPICNSQTCVEPLRR